VLGARTIRARLVVGDDHATTASGEADHHHDLYEYDEEDRVPEQVRTFLVDEVLADDKDEEEG